MADTNTDKESKSSSLDIPESDVHFTEHLAAHISATQHHLTGAPEPPEPPYAPSFHPPTGYWTAAEKALFFRALSVHSRFRPDLIAASIGTKSTVDVAVYLSLLRDGASRTNPSITRDLHPAAHEVSDTLVALEEEHAARICAAEPVHAREETSEARAEEARNVKDGMRLRRGEGGEGQERDREGQRAHREAFKRWQGEREVEWAKEDVLGRLDVVGLQVLDRVLRLDEESRKEADSGGELEEENEPSITLHHPAASSSSPDLPFPDGGTEGEDPGSIPSRLSPASRRRMYKRLYMRRKRAKASGGVAQLDTARLKTGRKASAMSKHRQPRVNSDSEDETGNPKRPARGHTLPYKIQCELERLGIGADFLRGNGMGLFHLSALGHLMRLYPRLDASQPQGVAESIAAETIQMLHALVTQFIRDLVRRVIALRELDFALRAHTKVWRLGKRVVPPLHVRRALELSGLDAQLSKRTHFGALLEQFSEGEESMESGDDVPLAVPARMAKGKAVACNEDDDEDDDEDHADDDEDRADDVGEGDQQQDQQQQKAGPSTDSQARDAADPHWSLTHREMYSPFVYAPGLIAPAHPFGVYAPGTMPDPQGPSTLALLRHAADDDDGEEDGDMEAFQEEEEDLMPAETDDEALEAELRAESRLDAADALAAAEYEAGARRELEGVGRGGGPSPRTKKRRALTDGDGSDAHSVRLRKRRKGALGRSAPTVAEAGMDALEEPDGVKVKSTAMIEDSGSG